jgi:hypothetical protein
MEEKNTTLEVLDTQESQEAVTKELTKPISQEEFEKQIHQAAVANHQLVIENFKKGILHLKDYSGVRKFRSIRRAIRRGLVSLYGDLYPNRPFKNIKTTRGSVTYKKRRYYEQFTHKNRKVA